MWMQRSLVTALCIAMPTLAFAQPDPPQEPETAPLGGFAIERMENGFVIAPDFKFTDIDNAFGSLAGLYGGWVMDHRLLIGGGAYWLTNGSADLEMAYGAPSRSGSRTPAGPLISACAAWSASGMPRCRMRSTFGSFRPPGAPHSSVAIGGTLSG